MNTPDRDIFKRGSERWLEVMEDELAQQRADAYHAMRGDDDDESTWEEQ